MRKLLASFLILAAAGIARADEWHQQYKVTAKPTVTIDCGDGNVDVVTGSAAQVDASVTTEGYTIGPDGVRIEANQSGNHVDIVIKVPHEHFSFGRHSIRVELKVPSESDLDLHTSDGNVSIASVKGSERIRTGDGNVTARGLDGTLSATSGDGNINVDGRFDQLDLRSGDGEIEADARTGSKMAMGWSLSSGDGNITLRVPDGFGADLDAHTGDGRVTVDFPVTMSGSMREGTVRGKLNGGGSILTMHSGDGNLRLGRS
ncbi:MAG TPA: DUF4097 family beta strand repeat-containing protein [Terriglobales bacterium]|nr:DUF4097 family beta strand repeat-containing protein [Terriglobales bacterium]